MQSRAGQEPISCPALLSLPRYGRINRMAISR